MLLKQDNTVNDLRDKQDSQKAQCELESEKIREAALFASSAKIDVFRKKKSFWTASI